MAEFGDTLRVDPAYSVKSYLSTLLGLAIDRGLVRNVTDPVGSYIKDGGRFATQRENYLGAACPPNQRVGRRPIWQAAHVHWSSGVRSGEMKPRELSEPGTYFEYNDAHQSVFLSLACWNRLLPEVLKTEVMN